MRFVVCLVGLFIGAGLSGQNNPPGPQDVLDKFGFTAHHIGQGVDTVQFYLHQKKDSHPKYLVLYLQGTSPDPLFSIEKEAGKFNTYRWFPDDYKSLNEDYAFAVIAKTGIPGILEIDDKRDVASYHQFNSLDHRVAQADTVINYLSQNMGMSLEKVIVYGHSEGAPVAAKLGTVNQKITHLGFWAGNALPDFYDFVLFNSHSAWSGQISQEKAVENNLALIQSFQKIAEDPGDTNAEDLDDYSNKRWWSYAEPPINQLLNIEIPIFVQVAGNDESAPIESTYLIPLEFARLRKANLTYEVCVPCDHSFVVEKEDGTTEDRWRSIFQRFISWTE